MRTLLALLLLASSLCGKSAVAPPDTAVIACQPAPPPADAKALSATRDLFLERAKVAGVPLPAAPALSPSPRWADLTAPQQADIEKAAGSAAAAPCYYGWMFGWYLAPRELARNLVDVADAQVQDRPALADDLTVAFLASQEGGEERLANLAKLLDASRSDDQKRALASLARRHQLKFDALVGGLKHK